MLWRVNCQTENIQRIGVVPNFVIAVSLLSYVKVLQQIWARCLLISNPLVKGYRKHIKRNVHRVIDKRTYQLTGKRVLLYKSGFLQFFWDSLARATIACRLPKSNPTPSSCGSCRLTGLRQTVRGVSNPITVDNCYGNCWSEKCTTTGWGRRFPAWSWTNDYTAQDPATLGPKVKVPYWLLECQNCVSNRQDRTGGKGDWTTAHNHGNKTKKIMEVAWACEQERPR